MGKVENVLGLVNSWELGKGENPNSSPLAVVRKHDPQELSFRLHLFPDSRGY
jgi:hypothetical protein